MSDYLIPAADTAEFPTRERCHITEIFNDPRWPQASLARARVEPDVTTEWHSLDVDEVYLVREGQGRMEVGDAAPFAIGPGDAVTIPAGVRQRVTNTGAEDLLVDCLCTPRFRAEGYRALEPGGD